MAAIREIITQSSADLAREFESINVDEGGFGIMAPKSFAHLLRLRNLPSPAANILKQEMLSVGGECATSRTVILGDSEPGDVILMGNRRQLATLARKLKAQPFGLKKVSRQLQQFLGNVANGRGDLSAPLDFLTTGREHYPLIMGILNVTKDSFSDGGRFLALPAAVKQGQAMAQSGADIIDIGGESTRPGSDSVGQEEELRRVVPVVAALREKTAVPISIDTMKATVAYEALQAGATMVNDVSAGRHDPGLLEVVATAGCPYIIMHMQGLPGTMQDSPHYDLLMDELHRFFEERLVVAVKAGIDERRLILDPGIGFGKRRSDNYEILRRLREFKIFGRPVMVGVSRKSFLQNPLGETPQDRLEESIAAGAIAMANGADILRVHDVLPALKSRAVFQELDAGA